MIIIKILVLIFSVVVHECAHGWTALMHGDPTARDAGRLTLNPLRHLDPIGSIVVPLVLALAGGIPLAWAKPVPVRADLLNDPKNDQPKVAAAGPASNLLLALVFAIGLGLLIRFGETAIMPGIRGAEPTFAYFLYSMFQLAVMINVALALFNLVPLPPLDGSWILWRFLPRQAKIRYAVLQRYGFLTVIGFLLLVRYTGFGSIVLGIFSLVLKPYLNIANTIAGMGS